MTFNVDGFEELADELRRQADSFDAPKDAIADGINESMDQRVVPESKKEAEQYVRSQDAATIDHGPGEWSGDTYRHPFYATSDIVAYHEFGTGGHASDSSRGTVNGTTFRGQPGYIIRPRGNWPLGIPARRWRGPASMVNTETGKVHLQYVVHPGVPAQHFMQHTLEDNTAVIQGYVGQAVRQAMEDNA